MAVYQNAVDPFNDGSGVALYRLDSDALDSGGNYDGTWNGTEQYDSAVYGNGALLDGSSEIGLPVESCNSDILTVSLWFKSTQTDVPIGIFSARGSASSTVKIVMALNRDNAGEIGLDSCNASGFVKLGTYNGNYNDGNFHHFVAMLDFVDSEYSAYVDGTEVFSGSSTTLENPTIDRVSIGTNYGSQYLVGTVDQVRIFNRMLTSDEVAQLGNEYPPILYNSVTFPYRISGTFSASSVTFPYRIVTKFSGVSASFPYRIKRFKKSSRLFPYSLSTQNIVTRIIRE